MEMRRAIIDEYGRIRITLVEELSFESTETMWPKNIFCGAGC
ncbi:MAG: hypothetical protein ACP5GY_03205 [Vulcanisaeta sp.]